MCASDIDLADNRGWPPAGRRASVRARHRPGRAGGAAFRRDGSAPSDRVARAQRGRRGGVPVPRRRRVGAGDQAGARRTFGHRRSGARKEASLTRADLPRVLLVALLGGFAGPALLVYGLKGTGAVRASLLLTLEAPLTALLAAALFREYVSRRVWFAVTLITLGAATLAYPALAHRAAGARRRATSSSFWPAWPGRSTTASPASSPIAIRWRSSPPRASAAPRCRSPWPSPPDGSPSTSAPRCDSWLSARSAMD